MRIPLSWLKEFIPITQTPEEIAKILTMAGLEVDSFETIGENLKGVVVGYVMESSKHPNADKLSVATVTDGKETIQVVCGGPNCRKGIKVALARIGTVLKNDNEEFTIKKSKIRGIESFGMLCGSEEIGLPKGEEGMIMELSPDLPEGKPLSDIYADTYFEISLTPNLSHCNSILGVARELAALIEQSLNLPKIELHESEDLIENSFHVTVEDPVNCPRYACRLIKNIQVGPSPDWLKNRLEICGFRSVNNVVDAVNYVQLEMGHPLHAFDYDKLQGREIVVRKAQEGEIIQTLDGKERVLQGAMLTICDKTKPVAIAGVMGGLDSEIQETTKNLILESAYFDPMSIRRTSKQLNLMSDASKRFERGTDPNQILTVLTQAAHLIQKLAGGEIQSGVIDIQSKEFPATIISCRLSRINRLLGVILSRGEVENVFKRLQFKCHWDNQDLFIVHVPTYRNDIKSEIDLVEEAARLYGYDNIPRVGGKYLASSHPSPEIYYFEKEVRSRLIGEGLNEFLTCDLIGPSLLQIVQDPSESMIKVLNPTSIEQSILRTSLLPGLLQVVKHNFDHQNHQIAGFEIGRIHFKEGEKYQEQPVAGIILSGNSTPHYWGEKESEFDFFDLKGIIENLLAVLRIPQVIYKNIGLKTFHSGRQASLFIDSLELGSFGEIHPSIQRRLDVPQRIFFAELNLEAFLKLAKPIEKVKPLSIYPASERDWTLTISDTYPYADLQELILNQKCSYLEEVSLKVIYRSDKLPKGYQNLTLHFVYRDPSKTIEQEIVEKEHQKLILSALEKLGNTVI